jgi:hypothetical protein
MGEECSTEVEYATKMLVRKPEGTKSHGTIIYRCEDNIKINLNGIQEEDAD